MASANADEEVVYNLVKAVFDNFEDFKAQSALYVAISREGSAVNTRSVPYHPGAERYFREVGLIEQAYDLGGFGVPGLPNSFLGDTK